MSKDWSKTKPKVRKVPVSMSESADVVVLSWLQNHQLHNYNQAVNDIIVFVGMVELEREKKKAELKSERLKWRIKAEELI